MEGLSSTGLPRLVFEILNPSKLELEAYAGTIAAVTPTSGPNIYITRSAKRTDKN